MAYARDEIGFVHLHVHSSYSLLEGALPIETLAKLAAADHQPALALTDTNNLFGALEFSEKLWDKGLQPVIGCHLSVDFADGSAPGRGHTPGSALLPHLVLLAMNEAGYANLMWLVTHASLAAEEAGETRCLWEEIAQRNEGLILLTGGPGGAVDRALVEGHRDIAAARLDQIAAVFGDRAYVELQRDGRDNQQTQEAMLLGLAYARDMRIVATAEPFFPKSSDHEAHDALLAIAAGRLMSDDERRRVTPQHHFASRSDMKKRFADLPEALAATVEIALRVTYRPMVRKPILPRFAGDDVAAEAAELRRQAREGLAERLAAIGVAPGFDEGGYHDRLDFELGVI
ncbi:MAG: PHP domain-containing protein, partial [Bosea sp. (in: a-proteobacteria)]